MPKYIVHITGVSGSGKSFLGIILENKFKNIIVKDLDVLRDEFIQSYYGEKKWTFINEIKYQKYIDNFINNTYLPIIFVGLNDNFFGKNKNLYYNLHSQHNYFIDIDDNTVLKQKCIRFFKNFENDNYALDDLINNNNIFIKKIYNALKIECSIRKNISINNKWKKDYKKQGYIFMSSNDILNSVSTIIQTNS
jgi:hypothetical protein